MKLTNSYDALLVFFVAVICVAALAGMLMVVLS
jgi:hypothetical protein